MTTTDEPIITLDERSETARRPSNAPSLVAAAAMVVSCVASSPSWAGDKGAAPEVTQAFCDSIKHRYNAKHTRSVYRWKRKKHAAFIKYRTENYGYFKGFGKPSWSSSTPKKNSERTTFFGIGVRLNKRIIPALKCVERSIKAGCQDGKCTPKAEWPGECELKHKRFPYKPRNLSGIRFRNTFRGGEVSNHVYGIAIDLDPTKNTCCKCVKRWRNHPLCKRKDLKHPWQRMIMPMCWVVHFERYGFYWLGRDSLQDTIHFEFLGDPALVDRQVKRLRHR